LLPVRAVSVWRGPGPAGGVGRAGVLTAVAAAGVVGVVPGYLPAECAPVLFAGGVSAPRNASTRGARCVAWVTRSRWPPW
jgi:hypothetical protein